MTKRKLFIDADKLTEKRLERKLTITDLALQAGLSRTTVCYAGTRGGELENTVFKLATALGVSVDDITKGGTV